MTLNDEFVCELAVLSKRAKPTPEQSAQLLEGWHQYFDAADVRSDQQLEDFRAIMRARAQAGSISLVAPKFW
jgi:hypothetical protein